MTTTAKIFIILVCLFAFIFTPMAIQFAARMDNWRQVAQSFQDQAENDAAYARGMESIASSQMIHAEAVARQNQQALADARRQIQDLNQTIATLTADRNKLILGNDELTTANGFQSGALKVISSHHDELRKANNNLRTSELDLQTRNAQLLDQVKSLNAEKVILTAELNKRGQEVAVCREENDTLRKAQGLGRAGEFATGAAAPTAQSASAVGPRAPVRGQIKEVQGNLATVDVGSSSGLKPGMVMVVTRGTDYVCDLVITSEVSPTEAVGEVRKEQGQRIRPGDKVVDEVSFMARS